jgi:hypothetical protein
MKYLSFSMFFFMFISYSVINAYPNGITGKVSASSSGCGGEGCHGSSASQATSISISSKSGSFAINPGGTLELTAIVAHTSKAGAGINIGVKSSTTSAINQGVLNVIAGQGLKKSQNELVHSDIKDMTEGKASFSFTWTAPTVDGTYYLLACGNAVDKKNGQSGDQWNFMSPIAITVSSANSVQEHIFTNPIIAPNPLIGIGTLSFILEKSTEVEYSIIDALGNQVSKVNLGFLSAGPQYQTINTISQNLSSGHYSVILRTGLSVISLPMIIQH